MRNLATFIYSALMLVLVTLGYAVSSNKYFHSSSLASSIGGKAFHDKNRDGVYDATDTGFKNIKVLLNGVSTNGGNINLNTNTDVNGNYSFQGLVAGTYKVTFDLPIGSFGLTFAPKDISGDESTDSDVDAQGITSDIIIDGINSVGHVHAGIVDVTIPKISFVHPMLLNAKSGDTIVLNCEDGIQFDANSITSNDNSTENPTTSFSDYAIKKGNCLTDGFHSLLFCEWASTDGAGNSNAIHLIMKVVDTKAPNIVNVPNDVTTDFSLGQQAPLPNGVNAYDQCYGNIPVSFKADTTFVNCVKEITRTWSATDSCGNIATKKQKVTVLNSGTQNLAINVIKTKNPSCTVNDGSILISAKGTSVQYSIDNGDSYHPSNNFNGLGDGTYKVWVKDANGCKAFATTTLAKLRCPDTLRVVQLNGTKLDTCIGSFMQPTFTLNGGQSCGTPSNDVTITNTGNCISITARTGYVGTQSFCYKQCDPNNANNCSDVVIIVDVLPQRVVCQAGIVSDSVVNIFTADCNSKVTNCFNSNSANFIRNFTASINNVSVDSNTVEGCNYDSLCYYYYSTIPGQGNTGPYRLDHWFVNGNAYTLKRFNTISALVDSMNVWDPTGAWVIDPITFTIVKTGTNSNIYGEMKVTRLSNRHEGFMTLDCQAIPYGMKLCFFKGVNKVVFRDRTTGCEDTVTVNVTCPSINPPVANDDIYTTFKNTNIQFNVLTNDNAPGTLVPVFIIQGKGFKNGRVGFPGGPNGTLNYIPDNNFCGIDTLCYGICNQIGCDTACVYINVIADTTCVAPIALDDSLSTTKGVSKIITILSNDIFNCAIDSTVKIIRQGKKGISAITLQKALNYLPRRDSCGLDTVYYEICNKAGCDTAAVFVNIVCPPAVKPVAVDDSVSTLKNTQVLIKVLDNDSPNTTTKSVTILTDPKHGKITLNPSRQFVYTPDSGFCALDTFFYILCNTDNLCDTARVIVNVLAPVVKKPPLAVDDFVKTPKNTPIGINVLNNDNPNGTLVGGVRILTGPFHGGAIVNINNNNINYIPGNDYCGNDTLTYEICNIDGCDTATVYITIECPVIVKRPVLIDDFVTTTKDSSIIIDVCKNDTLNGPIYPRSINFAPKHGSINPDATDKCKILYKPDLGYCGKDTFSYIICSDPGLLCDTAEVYITVDCPVVCAKPIATDDFATTTVNVNKNINILTNDVSSCKIDTVRIIKNGTRGTGGINANRGLDYVPFKDSCGVDSIEYEICNVTGCDTAKVYISIVCDTCVKPIANNDVIRTPKNTNGSVNVLTNDIVKCKLDTLYIVKNGNLGTASKDNNGNVIYTPKPDTCGLDTLEYIICNAKGCDTASIFVNIACDTCTIPVANMDTALTKQNTSIMIAVLTNDVSNCPIDSLVVTSKPLHGGVVVSTGNGLVYKPDSTYCGKDTLIYKICNKAGCDTAIVFIDITCDTTRKLFPIAVDNVDTLLQNTDITINVLGNDTINGTRSCLNIITNAKNGINTITSPNASPPYHIFYIPNKGFCGKDSIQYEICNENGKDTAWARIFVRCEKLKIHNAMSPNGDTKNDHFTITGIEDFPDNHVIIWDRWGQRIYETRGYNNSNNRFEGDWNGNHLPDGTYFYCVDDGKGNLYNGYLQIHR
jgi:gliding motility-associated-like protein